MVDLAFRDESNAVVEKAKAKAKAKKELGNSSSSKLKRPSSKSRLSAASSPEWSGLSSASSSILNFAPFSIEDRAINCFLHNWSSKGSGPSHGYEIIKLPEYFTYQPQVFQLLPGASWRGYDGLGPTDEYSCKRFSH